MGNFDPHINSFTILSIETTWMAKLVWMIFSCFTFSTISTNMKTIIIQQQFNVTDALTS